MLGYLLVFFEIYWKRCGIIILVFNNLILKVKYIKFDILKFRLKYFVKFV